MSVFDSLPGLIEGKTPEAVDRLIDRASMLAEGQFDGGEDTELVREGFQTLKGASGDLAHLGAGEIVSVLANWGIGHPNTKAAFVSASMTFEERRAVSHAATAAAISARVEREKAWDRVAVVLEDVGMVVLKLIPFLLAAA